MLPGQVSQLLEIPPSTLRRYVKLFGELHLSPEANKKRGRKFSDLDIATLAKIREMALDGIKLETIAEQLEEVVQVDERSAATALTIPAVVALLKTSAEERQELREDVSSLHLEVGDLRAAVEAIQAEHSLSLWQRIRNRILPNSQK